MINTLLQLSEKKGEQYLDNFLNEDLVITEKIDSFRILFEKVNGVIQFYKKDNSPINLIERVLSDIYEEPIAEITNLIGENLLPENTVFGVLYVPTEKPIRLSYKNLPKYILTDVTVKNAHNNKILESLNFEKVTEWASILCFARPPIIFSGKLSEEQKRVLVNYDKKNYDDIIRNNFDEYCIKKYGENFNIPKLIEIAKYLEQIKKDYIPTKWIQNGWKVMAYLIGVGLTIWGIIIYGYKK